MEMRRLAIAYARNFLMKKPFSVNSHRHQCTKAARSMWVEVGRLDHLFSGDVLKAGQFFYNNVFGYRGIVLSPVKLTLYDFDAVQVKPHNSYNVGWADHLINSLTRDVYHYVALIDSRDYPYVRNMSGTHSCVDRFNLKNVGWDFPSHDEVAPYVAKIDPSFNHFVHEDFDQFFAKDSENTYSPTPNLNRELAHHQSKLGALRSYRKSTDNVRVTVTPSYSGIQWKYTVRLEYQGEPDSGVTLHHRFWTCKENDSQASKLDGSGVVGMMPCLSSSMSIFQYTSSVSLRSRNGQMWGQYLFKRSNGTEFMVDIPPFQLDTPGAEELAS